MRRKMLLIALISILGAFLIFAYAQKNERHNAADPQTTDAANLQKVTLDVQGMICAGCEHTVETTLNKVAGLKRVTASSACKTAEIEFEPEVTTVEQLTKAVSRLGFTATSKNCDAQAGTAAVSGGEELGTISLATLKSEFNAASDQVRVVSILSPNCPVCRKGKNVVRSVFEQYDSERLKGFVVWLPMWPGDQASAAHAQAGTLQDNRIAQGWDGDKTIANLFSKTLALKGSAWDIYLAYAPGVVWEDGAPPQPTFWMHQLTVDDGADQQLCLNPQQLRNEIGHLLTQRI